MKNLWNLLGLFLLSFFVFSLSVQARESTVNWSVKNSQGGIIPQAQENVTDWSTQDQQKEVVPKIRENVTDWYVKDFKAEFVLSTDSTMVVTEMITADCGQATGKHGIFRIVPTETKLETGGVIKTPIELLSITDFDGNPYKYQAIENKSDKTITWKIGDPDVTVTDVHQYKIVYKAKNVIRSSNQKFDEFYWNVGGNFWTMDIDVFQAIVIFPDTIKRDTIDLTLYAGVLGSKESALVESSWEDDHTLFLVATRSFAPGEGIALSASIPKNIFSLYQFSFWELYSQYLWFFLPLSIFLVCFLVWKKYGDDPTWNKVVIPEYEAPKNLDVFEVGMITTRGVFDEKFVTAAIIELAVKGALKIRECKTSIGLAVNEVLKTQKKKSEEIFSYEEGDFVLEKQDISRMTLSPHQQILFDNLFKKSSYRIKLSTLSKNKFYKAVPILSKEVVNSLSKKGFIEKRGLPFEKIFKPWGMVMMILPIFFYFEIPELFASNISPVSWIISGVVLFFFGIIMPKRTENGAEINWKIDGLKLYMNTAEKYRQRFYEKENIFETLLPYAIVFDITKEWAEKMKAIYGEAYFSQYHLTWFESSSQGNIFDIDSFSSSMDSLSSSIASSTSSPSGSGGSGSSGGGSGGGGGGGW